MFKRIKGWFNNLLDYLFHNHTQPVAEANTFSPGMWFILGGKPYLLHHDNPEHDLVAKFNQLLVAGVFQKNLSGGSGTWGYRVNAEDRSLFFFQYPMTGNNNALVLGDHQGIRVCMGDGFDKINCVELIGQAMDYLLSVLLTPTGETRDPSPMPKPAKKTQAKPEAPKDKPTLEYKGRKSYKNRTAFVAKRKENYHGSE